jgi:hypothetical protein
MGRVQAYVLFGYLGFTLMAAVLALAQSRLRPRPELAEGPHPAGVTVWQKYPAYILIFRSVGPGFRGKIGIISSGGVVDAHYHCAPIQIRTCARDPGGCLAGRQSLPG